MEQTAHDILKKYPCYNEMSFGEQLAMKQASTELAIAYHKSKCEEAGRELPTKEEIEALSFAYRTTIQQGKGFIKGYETCMERASKSLASLQSQLEAKDKEIEYLKHCEKAREEETEGWERLKVIAEENYPIEKIVGRDVSLVIEKLFKELKSQLQEAKAEVENLNKALDETCGVHYHIAMIKRGNTKCPTCKEHILD